MANKIKRNMRRRKGANKRSDDNGSLTTLSGVISFKQPAVSMIRRATGVTTITKAAIDVGIGQFFDLAQVINVSEITSLYDQYCFDKVTLTIELATPFLSNGIYPLVVAAPDYTDATTPTSAAQVFELAQAKAFQFGPNRTRFDITLKPRPGVLAFAGVTSGYIVPNGECWIGSENTTVDHYGVKLWFQDYNTVVNATASLRLAAVYHLKVRSSK